MNQNSGLDMMSDIFAIELGIIHPSVMMSEELGSIDAALKSLGSLEARKTKRKFRKFLRKSIKRFGGFTVTRGNRSSVRSVMYWEIRRLAFDRYFNGEGLPMEDDNYQR